MSMDESMKPKVQEVQQNIHKPETPKASLRSILEEADMEETMKEVEGGAPPSDSLLQVSS